MGFAAWVGILITFINLIPIGQLDGGLVARGWLGAAHERLSGRLHLAMLAIGGAVAAWLATSAWRDGYVGSGALGFAAQGAMPWLIWAVMLGVLKRVGGGRYHPPTTEAPLGRGRRRIVGLVAVVFVLVFTPVPMREVLVPLLGGIPR
jgi:membrane-associated protease RseP (regulator of RpoE activity)